MMQSVWKMAQMEWTISTIVTLLVIGNAPAPQSAASQPSSTM
jgi:hypothetical protein